MRSLMKLAGVFVVAAILFALAQTSARAEEKAYSCGTVAGVTADIAAHPNYASHVVLSGDEATRGVRFPNPEATELEAGLLVLRIDSALILIGFAADGRCGHMVVPPDYAEQVLRAIYGTSS